MTRDQELMIASDSAGDLAILLAKAAKDATTAEQAAKACYELLREVSKAAGEDPDIEVMIRAPGEPRHYSDTRCWCVAWEAGPHYWAVSGSLAITRAAGKLVEPWMGFDLMLYPSEWEEG